MEKVKAYAKEKGVSLKELRQYLFPNMKKTKSYDALYDMVLHECDTVFDAILSICEIKEQNKDKFSNCGFMFKNKNNMVDCQALNKAYCLLEGECHFFKTQETIDALNEKYPRKRCEENEM